MHTIDKIKKNVVSKINKALGTNIVQESDLVYPVDTKMGDLSYPCFDLSQELSSRGGPVKAGKPNEIANELASKLKPCQTVKTIEAIGPYINFKLQPKKFAQVLVEVDDKYGNNTAGKNKKIMVEYACPNINKAFHIGHLRNIVVGESIIRLLESTGYKVIRANYQGDVGMHIAKSLWGITKLKSEFTKVQTKDLVKRIEFLGKAYARGAQEFAKNEKIKEEIIEINDRIYNNEPSIQKIYKLARKWSLEYFEKIYKRLDSKFDHYYFESETAKRGVEIVQAGLKKGLFVESDGAIIFKGSEHGLHDRVFINSKGFPTYEAKDLALAEMQFKKYSPTKIMHVVGKEQTEYFKVLFKALEKTLPKSKDKEAHIAYGWVHLKKGKMSSRLGNIVTATEVIDLVNYEVLAATKTNNPKMSKKNLEQIAETVGLASVKYGLLKVGVDKDIAFDISESISVSGNSGAYLLYTYARINSIIKKSKKSVTKVVSDKLKRSEELMLLNIAKFPEAVAKASSDNDPSEVAKHLFDLAQQFNDYYHQVPILKSEEEDFRLSLITAVAQVLQKGCYLLGFDMVDKM